MLLYLIWAFLVGSLVLMIGVMIYNEWFAPQSADNLAAEGAAVGAGTTAVSAASSTMPYAASSFAPASRRGSRKRPAARKAAARHKGRGRRVTR